MVMAIPTHHHHVCKCSVGWILARRVLGSECKIRVLLPVIPLEVKFELSLNSLNPCDCCPQYYAQGEVSGDEYETEPKSFTPDVFTLQCLVITLFDPNPFAYYCIPPSKRGF
jgi:hypothetical protein